MRPASGLHPHRRVLSGGHRGIAVALLLALTAGHVGAQDGGKGEEKGQGQGEDGKEKRKKSEEEVLFEAIAAEWKAGDAAALAARFPARRKVSLRLPGIEGGDYRAGQAKALLGEYFAARTFSKVALKSAKELTGTFEVEYLRTPDRRKVKAELLLVLGTEEKKRVLLSARESP
jgi:hypothetical protein